jgi:hypothetical protein
VNDLAGDPNWLLSTVAVSAAVIVGLLGTLVFYRMLTASDASSSPAWVWGAVVALGYLAATGIVFPLVLMPARSGAFDPAARWGVAGIELAGTAWRRLVVGGYVSGLLLVGAYLLWAVAMTTGAPRRRRHGVDVSRDSEAS